MNEINNKQNEIYRYKFSKTFLPNLLEFSKIHKYDEPKLFKENWDNWIKNNSEMINREKMYLESLGYNGNVLNKMFKSVRYYFKNKSLEKKKTKKRRQYIELDRGFLDVIDDHLNNIGNNMKPSLAFKNFCEYLDNKKIINQEIKRLKSFGLNLNSINLKIKKTYKNRHYTKNK